MSASRWEKIATLPSPNDRRIAIRVNKEAERELRRGHPWLFDQSIDEQSHPGEPGDLAVIFDQKRKFLAIGLYDPTNPIRVRILQSRKPATINRDFFVERIKTAIQNRDVLPPNTNGYRLVHGENDLLPGIVIDRYDLTIVIKIYTLAWLPHLKDILIGLEEFMPYERVVLRLSRTVGQATEKLHGLYDGIILSGKPVVGPITFLENGICFEVDPIQGQKTGFFLDQRDNRLKVEQLAAGKSVLNLFSYSGGFSIYAARGGAKQVTSVDINPHALESAKRIFKRNQNLTSGSVCRHTMICKDVFQTLELFKSQGRKFEIVIIDPPSFANRQAKIPAAIAAYQHLTRLGLAVIQSGGLLVQASCSSRVSRTDFFEAIHSAAAQTGRVLAEIERTGHAIDHPIRIKEGEYLKCLFATVK
jgi:23S rRNA (cytosine1962-C5)-methyltransferase